MFRHKLLGFTALAAALGYAAWNNPNVTSAPATPPGPFDARLLAAAKEYVAWGRVDDEARWAPELCRMPRPAMARESESDDAKTHGRKLYSLFAKERKDYLQIAKKPSPVGQTIVKQSWIPVEVPDNGEKLEPKAIHTPGMEGKPHTGDTFLPFVRKYGKLFKAEKQADLFIMMKFDPKTPDTDEGWIYGTVSPDGTHVTSAGKVESCMRCHTKDTKDRLFGLPGWAK